ncbi:MAG TPA: glycosyltransferase family 39 protein [Alphaproteobacteria bacterium]|nr:glycosyltransferase family 39 protein [Alphaproteobacteria bacterium]
MSISLVRPHLFVTAISTRTSRLFWTFALTHLVLWTIVPTLTSPNAPLDVIEGYAWGREWLLGTYKHPPMQSWWLQILAILTNRAPWAHFFASQVAVLGAFWGVWQTGRRMMSETAALIGVMLLEAIVYYNFTSVEFNPNVLQLPFWSLIAYSFHRAVKDNSYRHWILLGVWSAGGLYTKYSTGLLLIALSSLMLIEPLARHRLKSFGPYIAVFVAFALFVPHLIWLNNHDYLPFAYTMDRLHTAKPHAMPNFIFAPMVLITGQLVVLLGFALLFLVFYGRNGTTRDDRSDAFDQAFLTTVTFGPFLLTLLIAGVGGFAVRDMWGTPFWSFLGIWAIAQFHPSFSQESLTRFVYAWSVAFFAVLLVYLTSNIIYPYVEEKTGRIHFPGKALANYVTDVWHDRYHQPLRFVIGDTWPAGNVAYYAAERPHVFIMGDKEISPWIKSGDLDRYGGAIVWCVRHCLGAQHQSDQAPDFIKEKFPNAEIQPPFTLARQTEADVEPVKMGWAIVPPKDTTPSTPYNP